ncbi:hypothetical protein GE061_008583 [Apolygus lucorum]|uniref:Uncharacterized protein n=1 Tax=Apolygus lucorum TaxID=248454 RepID=A0A8S9WL29_APOLU|nr:hypothetical protein GE061_008583 [Apolygus lucorum]
MAIRYLKNESGRVPDGAFTAQLNHGESTETRPSNGAERRHAGRSVEHDQACTKSSRPGTSTQPVPIARSSINPGESPRPGTSTQPEPIASSSINPGNPGESPTISEFCDRITLPPDSPPPDIQTTMDPPPRHPQKRVSVDFQQLRKEKARKEKRKKK